MTRAPRTRQVLHNRWSSWCQITFGHMHFESRCLPILMRFRSMAILAKNSISQANLLCVLTIRQQCTAMTMPARRIGFAYRCCHCLFQVEKATKAAFVPCAARFLLGRKLTIGLSVSTFSHTIRRFSIECVCRHACMVRAGKRGR